MSAGWAHVFTLGHSPDPDDAFMFYAMAEQKIDLRGYQFEHRLEDIQRLNERAMRGELDISAISIHAYAHVRDRYALLPCGASMGDGYGPMLVATDGDAPTAEAPDALRDWLHGRLIAIAQDSSGSAKETALSYASANGAGRALDRRDRRAGRGVRHT
jgi:1,4-dihydroxy-6-naphthoate synthase